MQLFHRVFAWIKYNLYYLGKPPWDTNQTPPELMDFIHSHEPGSALDIGCGTGTNCLALARAGWDVTGVDFAPEAIRKAKSKFQKEGFQGRFILADISILELKDHYFELVLDIGCYHRLNTASRKQYREILKRVLKPGGAFLLYGHQDTLFPDGKNNSNEDSNEKFQEFLVLEKRQEGEERPEVMGVWLWFRKPDG
jgi:ubiquinone/menaquinone biosynthesis C-methylase UbiE